MVFITKTIIKQTIITKKIQDCIFTTNKIRIDGQSIKLDRTNNKKQFLTPFLIINEL